MNPFYRLHNLRMENDEAKERMDALRPRFDSLRGRHENGTAPRAVSSFNLFQTPPAIATQMATLLQLEAGQTVLEPSAGLGRLIDAVQAFGQFSITAVESAAQCAGELFRSYESLAIKQRDFLTLTTADIGQFDRVIMNPPFKQWRDIKHISHATTFLKPGGRLVALCANGPQQNEKLKSICDQWIELPSASFKSEGTHVNVAMLVIYKLP
jgi:phospholipid N-methyltransferase